jgi:hypothetical protein
MSLLKIDVYAYYTYGAGVNIMFWCQYVDALWLHSCGMMRKRLHFCVDPEMREENPSRRWIAIMALVAEWYYHEDLVEESSTPGPKSEINALPFIWHWEIYISSLTLSFLISEMEMPMVSTYKTGCCYFFPFCFVEDT